MIKLNITSLNLREYDVTTLLKGYIVILVAIDSKNRAIFRSVASTPLLTLPERGNIPPLVALHGQPDR